MTGSVGSRQNDTIMKKRFDWKLAIPLLLILLFALAVSIRWRYHAEETAAVPENGLASAAEKLTGPTQFPEPTATVQMPEPSLLPCSRGEESLQEPAGPLAIYEVSLSSGDAVEIRNISNGPVQLSDYYLSDKNSNRKKLQLPEQELEPGAYYVSTELSLSVKGERLWLSDGEERLLDYAKVQDLTAGGSYGRMDGESGWFYFAVPSMGEENRDGFRRVSLPPQASLPSGVYENVDSVTVELSGPGQIHYTTDCNMPTVDSPVYTGAITLEETGILRAICVEEGALPSRVITFQYFLNEHHSLPILSFCSDDESAWTRVYWEGSRVEELPGMVALYANGEELFQQACGLRLKGFSATTDMMKKNIGFYFRGRYGDGALTDCDLFGTGSTEYSSLIARAGQDHRATLIRNELMQELCLQASDKVPTQHNRFCVMYMNGQYRGIYSLKENMNEHFFGDWYGVDPDSFVILRQRKLVKECAPLQEVIHFCTDNDMADPEQYRSFCRMFDIDNFIDYVLMEGFSGNTDLLENVRYFRSDQIDGRWRFAFFDLDCAFYAYEGGMRVIFQDYGKRNYDVTNMTRSLIRNPEFRDQLLSRYAQWVQGPLSPENVAREIDLLESEILPEIVRDRERVGIDVAYWERRMGELRSFADKAYVSATIDVLCEELELTEEERIAYFGDL